MSQLRLTKVAVFNELFILSFDCHDINKTDGHSLLRCDSRLTYLTTYGYVCVWTTRDEAAVVEYTLRYA